jgi:hypothetical protein
MYKFETNFAFPLIKINELITYTEVEKPTGISYFLLVLMNEYTDKNVKISHLLKQFGVPHDLNELFADEILKLINLDIIQSNRGYNRSYFEEYPLSTFSFTQKGKKVFLDEAIPTNINQEKKQDVYYNPATNQLTLTVDRDYGKSESSILGESFFRQFNIPDNEIIEEYLNSKKGNGLPIKKEEIILSSHTLNVEYHFITYPVSISIDDHDQISFEFEDSKLRMFFEKYYTNDMISSIILVKNKFKFPNGETTQTKLSQQIPYEKIYMPELTKSKISDKSLIDIHMDSYPTSNAKLTYASNSIIFALKSSLAFIKMYDLNRVYGYIPAGIFVNSEIFGMITLKLLIEKKIDQSQLGSILGELIAQYQTFEYENDHTFCYKNLLQLCKLTNSLTLVHQKIESWLLNLSIEEQILQLGRIKDRSVNEPMVYEFIKKKGINILNDYMKDVRLNNLETKLENANWIIKANKLSDMIVLERLFSNLDGSQTDPVQLYDLLDKLGYLSGDILTFLKESLGSILSSKSTSRLAIMKQTLDNALDSLQRLTNIKNYTNYAMKEMTNKDEFINQYKVFQDMLSNLSYLDQYDTNVLHPFKEFNLIFTKLNDLYTVEKNALGNPKAINEKLIDAKMMNGDILSVVSNLYVKFTYICKTKFDLDFDFMNMIQALEKKDIIDKEETTLLHRFRQYRNDLEHANAIKKPLDKAELLEVKKIVFKLEVMKS